jgi:CheY-like chemotaxis protein
VVPCSPLLAVLVSQNSALLRHLTATPFRQLDIDLHVAASGDEAVKIGTSTLLAVAILDAEMPGLSGYEAAKRIKAATPDCKVVLVLGKRITSAQMQSVAAAGCDEVLIAPMSADELYDAIAVQLGLPRPGNQRFTIALAVLTPSGPRPIEGYVNNLSVDGARLLLPNLLPEGTRLRLSITPEDAAEPTEILAEVVWAQERERDRKATIGASFLDIDDETRLLLARLTQWEVIEEPDRLRVVIKGDITEASSFQALVPILVGRVDFDLSQIVYINSLGVREWIRFLRDVNIQGYDLHACSVPFVLQASVIPAMIGRGTVVSFFAPYYCEDCDHHEDKLLQSAAVLAAGYQPPVFQCPRCSATMALDDLPERYLAFLMPEHADDTAH